MTVLETYKALREAGCSLRDIARREGVSHTTVLRRLRDGPRKCTHPDPLAQRLPLALQRKAVALYGEGFGCRFIARLLGTYPSTARRLLVRLGVTMRPPGTSCRLQPLRSKRTRGFKAK